MNRVQGKVALVTGAARGQGRAHAVRLAEEGADLVLVDVCEKPADIDYAGATPEDLAQTVAAVEQLDRRACTRRRTSATWTRCRPWWPRGSPSSAGSTSSSPTPAS